jgi:drug/metabolite transporter (DMT)-like permease
MTEPRAHLDARAMLLLVGLCALWGLGQVAVKVGNAGISPLLQAGLRSSGAALLLVGWTMARGVSILGRPWRVPYAATIAALFAAEFVCIYSGLVYTTVSRATLFLYMAPFIVTLGAHWVLPAEPLRPVKVVGLACAFAGLALAFAEGLRLPTRRELAGDALELGAAVLWGATTLVVKARGGGVSASRTLFYQLAGSGIALLTLSALAREAGVTNPSPAVITALAYQTVVIAFLSYLAWFRLLGRYPASELSAFTFWTPLFGVVAGALVLGERITPAIGVAVILVASGIYLVNRPDRRVGGTRGDVTSARLAPSARSCSRRDP